MKDLPPIAIAITIPALTKPGECRDGYLQSLAKIKTGDYSGVNWSIGRKPKHELLHIYIVSGGRVLSRFLIAGYESGSKKCWDGSVRSNFWVVSVDPEFPPREIKMKGFRGFRYIYEALW
ncbi:hypothetical protein JIN84_17920 [Luteolibacter yonseiensis]|uniref:Uncharacterized protein n=1 Tax=Luteolibacter yonseiensis TaxID=1144680 RepID=A0A934R339_9BACT|nr:hypothetical protein [Luteolibacter yonseiensis]MBK1817503.1 hypothetical protein [Luteolibacter yonseiensis]